MNIIDTRENPVPYHTVKVGAICKILWDDCSKPTYAIKIDTIDGNYGNYNAVDLEDGEAFELSLNHPTVVLNVELRVL